MAIGRGGNSIAPVFPQYAHRACLTTAQKDEPHPKVKGEVHLFAWGNL